ncbi:MAG: PocR ligand-binding domain-containing protein [Lagierella massiliensis]|nr:PocR ligand-binding domain-containing protein [Lagierella massiliensis]
MINSINKLIPRHKQKELEYSFGHASGFGVIFVDAQGNHIGKGGNFCKFCNLVNSCNEGRKKCARCNKDAIEKSKFSDEPAIYTCHAGLINIAIPLYHNNTLLGALTAGQVRCTKDSKYHDESEKVWPNTLNPKLLEEYFNEIPVLSDTEIESTVTALANITDYIIKLNANRIYVEEINRQKEILFEVEKQNLILESELSKIKYTTLQKQIMPHFIFNALTSISRLISLNRTAEANKMILSFSNMLRYVFSYSESSTTIRRELKCIQDYIDIQRIRFNGKFDYNYEIDEEALEVTIPYFSLQPLVENIFNHAFKNIQQLGKLELIIARANDHCKVEIIDNGSGISAEKLENIYSNINNNNGFSNSIGIFNSYSRFSLMFPNSFKFNILSKVNQGTRVVIDFDISDLSLF